MKTLKIIRDFDFASGLVAPAHFKERKACRCVVVDKTNKMAMIYAAKNNYRKLPGGGMDEGEDEETALRRELVEEIGCTVENIREVGMVEEYRNEIGLHQISYGFVAEVKEIGTPQLIASEIAEEYQTEWLDIDAAIEILEKELEVANYNGRFVLTRDIAILKEARALLLNK